MSKVNIFIIDDDADSIENLKIALNELAEQENVEFFNIFPKEGKYKKFTDTIKEKTTNKEELYEYIKKYIIENDIDLIILDFLLSNLEGNIDDNTINDGSNLINNSSGKLIIEKIIREDSILKNIPIVSYTRLESNVKDKKNQNLFKEPLAKIRFDIQKTSNYEDLVDNLKNNITKFYKIYFEAELYKNSKKETFDIAVICALKEEFEQIKNAFDINNDKDKFEKNNETYYKKYIKNTKGLEYKIVLSYICAMGMVEAATYTSKIISKFSPKLIIMTGIAAGIDRVEQNFGDILMPEWVYNWQFGKYHSKIDEKNNSYKKYFTPDMRQEQRNLEIDKKYLNSYKDTFFNNITDKYQIVMKGDPVIKEFQKTYNIHTDKMVSGSAVVADKEIIDNFINTNDRKVDGLDMESYGVAYAANKNDVKWLVIKSISDFADDNKDDDYHNYCSFASAKMAEILIKNHIVLK